MDNNQLNITAGSDVILNVTLEHEGTVMPPLMIDDLSAKLISGLGKQTTLEATAQADYIVVNVPWETGRVPGVYSLLLTGSVNGVQWAARASILKYTTNTESGASEVTVEGDTYDVTMNAGYHYTDTPINAVEVTVDGGVGTPSADVDYHDKELDFVFHDIKGETGDRGNGITSIETTESTEPGGINTVTIRTDDDPVGTLFHVQNGLVGPQGATVIHGAGDLVLDTVYGDSQEKGMTQKAITDLVTDYFEASSSELTNQDCSLGAGDKFFRWESQPQSHVVVPVSPGMVVTLKDTTTGTPMYGFFTDAYNPPYVNNDVAPYVAGYVGRISGVANVDFQVTIPEGCSYLCLVTCDGSLNGHVWTVKSVKTLKEKVEDIQGRVEVLEEEVESMPVLVDELGDSQEKGMTQKAITDLVADFLDVSSSELTKQDCSLGSGDKFFRFGDQPQSHVVVPVSPGMVVTLKDTTSNTSSFYGFFTDAYNPPYVNDDVAPYVTGYVGRITGAANTEFQVTIPEGCSFLCLVTCDGALKEHVWTAKYVKTLKEKVEDIQDMFLGSVELNMTAEDLNYNINATTSLFDNGTMKCRLIDISAYRGCGILFQANANGGFRYAFLRADYVKSGEQPIFASGCMVSGLIEAGTSDVIPYDASWLYVLSYNASNVSVLPSCVIDYGRLKDESAIVKGDTIDLSGLTHSARCLGEGSSWAMGLTATQEHVAIPVNEGEVYGLSSKGDGYYGLLSSSYTPPSSNSSVPYITGEHRRRTGEEQTVVTIPAGCAYLVLTTIDIFNGKIQWSVVRGTKKEFVRNNIEHNFLKLRFLHWNIGTFALGHLGTRSIITHDQYDEMYRKWAEKINAVNADFLAMCEYTDNFVEEEGGLPAISARDSVFSLFKYAEISQRPVETWPMEAAIYGNTPFYNIRQVPIPGQYRHYLAADVYYNGLQICIVETHLDYHQDESGIALRAESIEQMIDDLKGYSHIIICGDFNVGAISELDPFIDAGYALTNGGYMGEIKTHPAGEVQTLPLDNIVCKGFAINNIGIINDETLTDHCGLYADFTLI